MHKTTNYRAEKKYHVGVVQHFRKPIFLDDILPILSLKLKRSYVTNKKKSAFYPGLEKPAANDDPC